MVLRNSCRPSALAVANIVIRKLMPRQRPTAMKEAAGKYLPPQMGFAANIPRTIVDTHV